MMPAEYSEVFNGQLRALFSSALRLTLRNPRLAAHFYRTARWQDRAARRRRAWLERGLEVPPVIVVSVTNRCNLRCTGCYAHALRGGAAQEMDAAQLRRLLAEARELGIAIALLAGGEPLLRPDLAEVAAEFRDVVFPIFTNGLLIDEAWIARFRRQRNLIPVVSLDGLAVETDGRRGEGVYAQLERTIARMAGRGIFLGTSLTVTRSSFDTMVDERFVRDLIAAGCRIFFFVEYVPIGPQPEDLLLTAEQRARLIQKLDEFRSTLPGLFVGFPGDEEQYGGCLAAGRGFVHINAGGDVEPCPFAPYSDVSLKNASLRDALSSTFLADIRRNHEQLSETRGGCALWENRAWVQALLEQHRRAGETS
jgi:MoaA/NifB/PqqE/SkfB family radical SAM enzyme